MRPCAFRGEACRTRPPACGPAAATAAGLSLIVAFIANLLVAAEDREFAQRFNDEEAVDSAWPI
jgi:hypothetical protein